MVAIENLIYRLRTLLAFTRIPGNAFSYAVRRALNWSKGPPRLPGETMENLFGYLGNDASGAEARMQYLEKRYALAPLRQKSTRSLYRKNLYLLDLLEKAWRDVPEFSSPDSTVKAMDVGAQDWHYVFGLERWLRYGVTANPSAVALHGVELDGYGIYPDLHSRRDYALAYAAQTENTGVTYEVGDFLRSKGEGYDIITLFYPFVTRRALLLWGLPLRFFHPGEVVAKAARLTRPGGRMIVFNHTSEEHGIFQELAHASGQFTLLSAGDAHSNLVDFHRDVTSRRYSIWERNPTDI